MKKVIVIVEKARKNYSAYSEDVPGVIATGNTPEKLYQMFKEGMEFHFEESDNVPSWFKSGRYELFFKYEAKDLLEIYSQIFNKATLSRVTGINQRQLWFYASGDKMPREVQKKRIEDGLHKLGRELLSVKLV